MKLWSLLVVVLAALAPAARARSTAFTYQGRLSNGGNPASGRHDFRFSLFNAASGGSQVGSTQCVDNVTVSEGFFFTTMDFGQRFATKADRFLEIEVRRDTGLNCGNLTGFTILGPRQPLTAAPMASHAKSAFSLDAADGSPLAAVDVDSNGKVGIGISTPQATIHLLANEGGATPGEGIRIQGATGGADNVSYMTFVNGAGTRIGYIGDGGGADNNVFLTSDFGDVLLYNSNIGAVLTAKANGRVGIGTTSPLDKLDVRGDVRLGPSGQFLAAAGEENLRMLRGTFDRDGNKLRGSGFSVVMESQGKYRITYDVPFSSTPCVTATPYHNGGGDVRRLVMIGATSPSNVLLASYHPDHDDSSVSPIDFIVLGPR